MKWVETDLNCPWYPSFEDPHPSLAKNYPEQHAQVPDELCERLQAAWNNLRKISDEVDAYRHLTGQDKEDER